MSFLDIDLKDTREPNAVPADEEYQIRLLGITQDTDKNGHPYILPRFDVPAVPTSKDFTKFLALPHEGMDEKRINSCKWALKCFFDAFEIDHTKQIDFEEIIGRTAWAILGVSPDEGYGEQNYIKKFVRGA